MDEVPNLAEVRMNQAAGELEAALRGIAATGDEMSLAQWASRIAAGMLAQIIFIANVDIPQTVEAVTEVKEKAVMIIEGVGLDHARMLATAERAVEKAMEQMMAIEKAMEQMMANDN